MTLGEKQNGKVRTLIKDKHMPDTMMSTGDTSVLTQLRSSELLETEQQQQMEKGPYDKNNTIIKNAKQTDSTISFLRSARSGDLEKVIEFIESGQITDINTCNANGLNALHLAAKDGYIDIVNELLRRGAKVDNATKKGNTALHIASLAGQKEVIKLLIQYNANVNVQSLNGFTPLYMAAQENHDACVRYLLAKGANPSLATEDGFTPLAVAMQQGHDKVVAVLLESDSRGKVRLPALHIAAKKDDVKAATLLLENEHNPDIVSKSGFTPLHIAAHYGNVNIANLLIDRGADVNYIAKHNITPLHVACKWGKTNILKLLLSKHARIDATTRDGLTPLHCAARSGHKDVIEILLANEAPILSKTKNGLAPLHMTAQGEHDEAARILLVHKAPVDEVTVDYLTALHVSAHCGHVRVAKLLLDYNADPNARALNGFTPLHIACKKNRIKVVELLLKHNASISATTESGLTPLHVASFMGCMNIVIYLLQHDANPDAPTVRGETPLHLAARANQTDIIRILLRNGAQVDSKAREGQTPLHVASRLGNNDIIMLLLQHGADVDASTKDAYTPLHIAAKEGQDEVAQLLIENNAKLDATTKKGFSPMHLAAKYGKVQVVRLLLQKGATVDCQGKNGVTPLHVAAHYDHQNVALLLLERGAQPHISAKNGHTALHIAAKKNQVEIAQNLLQYSADPNVRSKSGFAPLHLAAQEGNIDMVNLLLEHGADANLMAKNGLTPLHLCAQEDNTNVAQVLLANKANISERTMAGYTPLHVAAHYGQINMVKYLLENDASIEMSTNIGYTPLHQAAQQGHTLVINLLLTHKADPNALTKNGQTALSIADKLGYVTAVETLKIVTEKSVTNIVTGVLEEKYKVVAPESMHEAFMSDSEDEGGDDHLDQHQYKYMATDELKRIINEHDQQNYDTTDNDEHDGAHVISNGRNAVNENMSKAYINYNVSASNPYTIKQADNVVIARPPIHLGFLVSFLVDARGGAMRGCRHSGVRVIVPPKACAQPTRITCRYVKLQRVPNPPPLMEGEALVSRIMELSPVEAKFLSPVILEVPHFGSLRDKEREIIILRSDNGESWREHTLNDSQDAVRDVLSESFDGGELNPLEDLHTNRIIRVSTRKFPHFFAVVSRIRQEVHAIGPDGGTVSSQAVPQVQAIFPPHALTKKIRVGLQAQPVDLNGCCKLLGRGVAVSPVVTVEPRRRKFHKAITLSIPAPKAYSQGMVNSQYSGTAPTLRLLCSITGGQNRAIWEDVTGSTPLAFVKDSVSFTTTVSARFWLMDCRNITDASRMATELYSYMAQVPFMVKFVVFAKRISHNEAKFSVFCMTDDKEDKTLEQQEYFTEVAKSRDIEVLEDQDIYLEFAGNLVPVLKSGEQLNMKFQAFRENRLSFVVHVKDQEEPYGRVTFMSEPKAGKGEPPQQPICSLNVSLEGHEIVESTNRNNDSQRSLNTITLDRGLNYRDLINFGYNLKKGTAALESAGVGRAEVADTIHKADIRLSDICNLLESDWVPLALELNVPVTDIELIKTEYVDHPSQQAMVMLRLWLQQQGPQANGNSLEQALHIIGRSDIVKQCMFNLELVTDDMERALAKEQLDQSLIDGLHADLNYENGNSPKSDPLGVPNTNTNTNGNKLAHTMQHDVSALNDTLQSEFSYAEKVDDDAESENQFKYDNGDKHEFCVIECTTLPPNTNASTKTNTVTGTDYGMETIPPKAEESTKLLLKDTHQKIDESVHHPEASTSHKEGKQSSPSLLPESLQRTIETTFDIKAPHEWPADNPVEDGLISASAPLDQLTKTIKRGSHMAIKSKIPRPTIDDINWTVTNDANMADVVGDARVTEISSVNLDDVVEFDDVTSMKYNVENISRSSSYYDVACENNQCVETLQIDSADRLLASQTTTPITATTTASTNSKQQTKYTDTARNADGSETQFSSSEERKTNEAGENISQLHRAGNVGDNTVVGDIIVGQNVSRDSSEAPPFFQALTADSIKPQKSSTKSWENSIENKALCSSSESDLALHEPGMELSEDDDADTVDTDFYQDAVKSANSITTETVTLFKDNGSSTCTTTPTHFVTKVGHMCSEEELTGMESKVMQPLSEVDLSTGSTTASRTITRKLTQDSENLKSDEGKSPELLITNIITQTRQTGDRVFGKADEELLKLSINSESVQNRCGSVHFTRQEEQK